MELAGLSHGKKIGKATVHIDIVKKGNPEVRPGTSMKPEFITIHNTGNPGRGANAKAHNSYLHNQSKLPVKDTSHISWHITVDEDHIYVHLPFNETAWHCGDGANGKGNMKSIGIEICMHVDQKNYDQAEDNAVAIAAYLVNYFGLKTSAVVPHQKWSGKNCPAIILKRDGSLKIFVARVEETMKAPVVIEKPSVAHLGKTFATLANEVIAGKHGTGDARKKSLGTAYDEVQKLVNQMLSGTVATPKPVIKTTAQLAQEVIKGLHGNGADRMKSLGTRYAEVQKEVTRILKGK